MTKDNLHQTETPDVSHIRNVEVTHERSDVNVGAIVKFIVLLTVATAAVYVLMWGLFRLFNAQAERGPAPGPMAMSEVERLPPEPRLQGAKGFGDDLAATVGDKDSPHPRDPEWEIRVLYGAWNDSLTQGRRGPNGEILGMPIDDAIKKVVTDGLPSRATAQTKPPLRDFAISTPTAASSGRTTEKRLQ